ncbi:HRDC domain-containing protein [Neomicrococcus aestuarii]|uniref:Ribonuclease D n=1 Tax=Neomicrococcus aestuarii TaxID=556325 RepID=A0A1L2ZL76_9MICC|nr:HRDC domain-containing protein [Neomicrococcus aestuarii]APF39791.1 ribonuclease D [Neomicrococcus aestuarii]MBB5513823.1 ribonuclease D [Neomicrococcus aestuarii]
MTLDSQNDAAASAPAESPVERTLIDLTEPRDGVPFVIDTERGLARAAEALAAGTGPASVDAERASGFRYGQRAFLVQIRREGAGTWLIDPEAFNGLESINEALSGVEWILHAATQDLPCLAEQGMTPDALFDTELAARIAGLPKVGLAAVVEHFLGLRLAKEHSAADWSKRPLPEPWLRYAALDVEVLDELREDLIELLTQQGKLDFALEEFEAIRTAPLPGPREDPWRRTSGIHTIKDRRQLATVRELWEEREHLAQKRDVAPGKLLPDAAIVVAAKAMPSSVPELLKTHGFSGRAAKTEAARWVSAIQTAKRLRSLPPLTVPNNAPPPPRVWADRNVEAARRLNTAKQRVAAAAAKLNMPTENLLQPDTIRRLAWTPPASVTPESIEEALRERGAREWQIKITSPIITVAFLDPDPLPEKD